ncbi:phage tail tape measure protein [Clostridioides difficile]|nr:phage tail tape measure protein [Clostridioides difficile]
MGRTTSFTAKDAGNAMYFMGMAGWKSKEMIAGLPGILNLAATGQTDLALTADIVTDGLTALGLTAKDTGMFVDVMAATVTNSNTDIERMGETFKYMGSVGGALGVSMKDLSLATGLMASASVKGSMAGTALRGGLVRLIKPQLRHRKL